MYWQYRTILFEYHKDGLLGDKYIDDEQVEKVLNEQGEEGWELVAVTPVQEGLLSFFKRDLRQPAKRGVMENTAAAGAAKATGSLLQERESAGAAGQQSGHTLPGNERKETPPVGKANKVGEIKIS